MNTVYSASQVASVLGEETRNLRMWRLRGLCHLGSSTGQSHRRYTVADACKMAAALALRDVGYALETAFNRCSGPSDVSQAIDAATDGDWSKVDERFLIVGRAYHFDGTRSVFTKLVNKSELESFPVTQRLRDDLDGAPILSKSIIDLGDLVRFVFLMLPSSTSEANEDEAGE